MKPCGHCGRLNDDAAGWCLTCGKELFPAASSSLPQIPPKIWEVSRRFSSEIKDSGGGMLTIKCRTPDEAYLIMEQLARSDIIAVSPGRMNMAQACLRKGYVGIEISARAYRRATELRGVVESRSRRRGFRPMVSTAWTATSICILVLICLLAFIIGRMMLSDSF